MSGEAGLSHVAIAGASGHLGNHILSAFSSDLFRSSFASITLLKRHKPSNHGGTEQNEKYYQTRYYDEDKLGEALEEIDVLVSAVGPSGHAFKDKLLKAVPKSSVKLYIPSEFGVDHTLHDFAHVEWDHKKYHAQLAKNLLPSDIRMCRIFIGLFIEDSIGPWFGFGTANSQYECIGSGATPVSYTSLDDVGKVVAQLSRMSVDDVPPIVHIGGDTLSTTDLAALMTSAGGGEITISERDIVAYKDETLKGQTTDPSRYLRFLMGEGKINHSSTGTGNDNELVNPKQEIWKWKSMKDYAMETNGRPWAEIEWSNDDVH